MTPRRVAAYLVSATVLVAWLASAAGLGEPRAPQPSVPEPVQTSGTESLAQEVQAQTKRLRARLASAPAPQSPPRNPFRFSSSTPPVPRRAAKPAPAAAPPSAVAFAEPALQLAGVAEDETSEGTVRTAVITTDGGEVLIVKAGDQLGARYRVQSVGADAVELADLTTGATRRLTLR